MYNKKSKSTTCLCLINECDMIYCSAVSNMILDQGYNNCAALYRSSCSLQDVDEWTIVCFHRAAYKTLNASFNSVTVAVAIILSHKTSYDYHTMVTVITEHIHEC